MNRPAHYSSDVLFFFDGRPAQLALYQALEARMDAVFPKEEVSVKVQKSQISFYGARLFAMVSHPKRKREAGIVLSFGLGRRESSPRIGVAVEPYPGRWTHHATVTAEEELDGELMGWIREAYAFNQAKGRGKTP